MTLGWAEGSAVSSATIVLGLALVGSLYLMREFRWMSRPWQHHANPQALAVRSLPPTALHLRLYRLSVDAAATAAMLRGLPSTFPGALRPVALRTDPASEALMRNLAAEDAPVPAVGPGGCLLALASRPPGHSRYYRDSPADLHDQARDALGSRALAATPLYLLPEDRRGLLTHPWATDADADFSEAFRRVAGSDGASLLVLHTARAQGGGRCRA